MNLISYVAGFMFDRVTKEVALIRKKKPEWQAGKLNAIGGKFEPGESLIAAMVREFKEETGCITTEHQWRHFSALISPTWCVHFFATFGDLYSLTSPEEEKIEIHEIATITMRSDLIGNVPWLIALALDAMESSGPSFVTAHYPAS